MSRLDRSYGVREVTNRDQNGGARTKYSMESDGQLNAMETSFNVTENKMEEERPMQMTVKSIPDNDSKRVQTI